MFELYLICFMFCLGAAAHRVDTWNHNTEKHQIALKDALACFILAIGVLLNWGIVYFFNEKTPFLLFIFGMAALIVECCKGEICPLENRERAHICVHSLKTWRARCQNKFPKAWAF